MKGWTSDSVVDFQGPEGLKRWQQQTGNDKHTKIITNPGYANYSGTGQGGRPEADGKPAWLDDCRLAPDSPLRGAASDGSDIGIRFPKRRGGMRVRDRQEALDGKPWEK